MQQHIHPWRFLYCSSHIFHCPHSVSAVGCGVATNQHSQLPAEPPELIPPAGADPASFGASIQRRGAAAAGRGCSLGCRGDIQGP